ncbi:hypothetical protein LINPERPRIM_LOCUS38039, partial [Linum perenne]
PGLVVIRVGPSGGPRLRAGLGPRLGSGSGSGALSLQGSGGGAGVGLGLV